MAKRINGRHSRGYVKAQTPFKNSNGQLYAEWLGLDGRENSEARYCVYSYGRYWPLFIYVPHVSTWFENKDRCSTTTSKHRTFTHPHCDTVSLTLEQMTVLDRLGYTSLVYDRLVGTTKENTNG